MTRVLAGLLIVLGGPTALGAQNSVYGVQGIGFPGRPIGVRARALAGGNAVFDPGSALNPAAVAGFTRIIASMSIGTTLRSYSAGDTTVGGLRETRFPFGMLGTPLGATRFAVALSYGPYAERSFDVRTTGTEVVRGDTVTVDDRVAMDGGMSDLRGALAYRLRPGIMLGGAVHLIAGSSKLRVRRDFSNPAYRSYVQQSDVTFSGAGVAAGAVLRVSAGLQLAAAARADGRLNTAVGSAPADTVDLPVALAAGVRLVPVRGVTWATTGIWRSWSDAGPDLAAGMRAFDTWDIGSGVEIGGAESGASRIPLRLGVRYASLPFSARDAQPTEITLAGGTGLLFAEGRIAFDVAVERALRSGAGAREEAWHLAVGVLVVP